MGLFADGAAVRTTGAETFRVARDYVDSMMTVTTDEICQVKGNGTPRHKRLVLGETFLSRAVSIS